MKPSEIQFTLGNQVYGPVPPALPGPVLTCACGGTRFTESASFEISLSANALALVELTTHGTTEYGISKSKTLRTVICDACCEVAVLTRQEKK
jgi:hypothetical protein